MSWRVHPVQSSELVHAEGSGSTGVLQVAGSRLGPGGCFGPALAAAAARAEHADGRAVHVPVGVLEGASGICGHAGRRVGATRPMGPDRGGHGMKNQPSAARTGWCVGWRKGSVRRGWRWTAVTAVEAS